MLKVVCVKHGDKYGPEFVNILHDMVQRNLFPVTGGEFVCFTDSASGLAEGVTVRELPADVKGWWCKLWLFSRDLFDQGDRILYFDLDTVITGALEPFAAYQGDFAICRDFMGAGWNSSIMLWRAGFGNHIWENWRAEGMPDLPGGDQEWIERQVKDADLLQTILPGSVASYKVDCFMQFPAKGTIAVCFHGEPKPDNCGAEWVRMVWKIGGGSAAELAMVCNTEEQRLFDNIRSACARDFPWLDFKEAHEGHAVIVGGGPSAAGFVEEIRWRQSIGQTVVALNGSHDWLLDHGIVPDWHVLLDARPENIRFVKRPSTARRLIASQCAPELIDAAGDNVTVWHSNIHGLDAVIPHGDRPEVFINAGSTVGLSALTITYAQGFREQHLYGFDSSYAEGQGHAYAQPENDADQVMDAVCEGRSFRAAPWMVAQANQFMVVANDLANAGCTISVHGDGLLPWIARQMQFSSAPDTAAVEIDGIWWPSRDRMARPYILGSLGDIDTMLSHTQRRKVAVQAGGNVGIYPRELAKHFETVYTFEPDTLNFDCLRRNAPGVVAQNSALGDEPGRATLARDPSNCGAHYIEEGDEFEVVRLDDMVLPGCDLLQLDVEGHEFQALRGAEKTIARHKPTIVLEIKGHGSRYGYSDDELTAWLTARGYTERARFGRDVLFSTT